MVLKSVTFDAQDPQMQFVDPLHYLEHGNSGAFASEEVPHDVIHDSSVGADFSAAAAEEHVEPSQILDGISDIVVQEGRVPERFL